MFTSPDPDSSSSAASLVLTPAPATRRESTAVQTARKRKDQTEVSHFLTHKLLCWLKPFNFRVHTAENSHSNSSQLNGPPHTATLLNRRPTRRSEMNIKLHFTTLTLSSHQTVCLRPFSTSSPSLRLSPIILELQFLPFTLSTVLSFLWLFTHSPLLLPSSVRKIHFVYMCKICGYYQIYRQVF